MRTFPFYLRSARSEDVVVQNVPKLTPPTPRKAQSARPRLSRGASKKRAASKLRPQLEEEESEKLYEGASIEPMKEHPPMELLFTAVAGYAQFKCDCSSITFDQVEVYAESAQT